MLTTRDEPEEGVLAGLGELARSLGCSIRELLSGCRRFAQGTTIGTNAVLERKGARVGLVTTAGHGDALAIMRGSGRVAGLPIEAIYRVHGSKRPTPLVDRAAVLELDERIDSQGNVVVALDPVKAAQRLQHFVRSQQIESVAVVLLWSFANDEHERAVGRILAELFPQLYVSLSVDVSPRLGEYERMVATAIDGYVGPASAAYLERLGKRLHEEGLRSPPLAMQSNGGVLPFGDASRSALRIVDSGPAGGVVGTARLARLHGHENVIATDMGGTSFDVGLIVAGEPVVTDEDVIAGFTYRMPRLDVRSIACGGGTIARFDERTRSLRVGPDSAGSEPGPICYGRGGTLPTVTDADVVLGLVRPESFLGGRMPLDREAARAGMAKLGEQLGLSIEATAAGILRINNAHAAALIRRRTLERGFDPREFVLYAYGGAGPVHAFELVGELGPREVIIPLANGASTLSAYGIGTTDISRYLEREAVFEAPFDGERLAAAIERIVSETQAKLRDAADMGEVEVRTWALMRFREQLMHSLEVPIELPLEPKELERRFADEYGRRYGAGALSVFQGIEVFALRARGRIRSDITGSPKHTASGRAPEAIAISDVFWPTSMQWIATPVFDGARLINADVALAGPALVELPHTTIPVPQTMELSVLATGSLRLSSRGGSR